MAAKWFEVWACVTTFLLPRTFEACFVTQLVEGDHIFYEITIGIERGRRGNLGDSLHPTILHGYRFQIQNLFNVSEHR